MASKHQKRKASIRLFGSLALLACFVVSTISCRSGEGGRRSVENQAKGRHVAHRWAQRIDLPGVPNLHKVSDDLYRGAQPTAEGLRQLERLGIKTIVNLRFLTSDRKLLRGTQLDYEHINTTTLTTDTRDIIRLLKIVAAPERTPVFVHCHRGVDRTGVMCAAYRIIVQDWTKEEAIQEMVKGGFTSGTVRRNLLDYIHNMNVDNIRNRLGLID